LTGTAETSRLSPRNGFTVYFVLSPVSGLFCHRHCMGLTSSLTPGSRRQDHTTSPSAAAFSSGEQKPADAASVHRNPRQRYVTMRIVPFGGTGWGIDTVNQNSGKVKYFCFRGLTCSANQKQCRQAGPFTSLGILGSMRPATLCRLPFVGSLDVRSLGAERRWQFAGLILEIGRHPYKPGCHIGIGS